MLEDDNFYGKKSRIKESMWKGGRGRFRVLNRGGSGKAYMRRGHLNRDLRR